MKHSMSVYCCASYSSHKSNLFSEISNQKYFLLLSNQFLLYAGNHVAERNESPTVLLDELDRSAGYSVCRPNYVHFVYESYSV